MKTYFSLFGLAPARIGGTEVYARELSRQLGDRGWRSVLCFRSLPGGDVREYLDLPNVAMEAIPDLETPGFGCLARTRALLSAHRPETLHLHYLGLVSPFPWLARLCGVPRVYFSDHTSRRLGFVPHPLAAWKRWPARAMAAPVQGAITVSEFGDRCLRRMGVVAPDKVRRIYNGVDLCATGDPAQFRARYGIPVDAPLVVQVSNMIPEKGVDHFLEAAKLVLARYPQTRFALVGEGAGRAGFERHAAALGIADAVTFTGLMLDPVREGAYQAADVVCLMSAWEEVFGFVIAEAMAQGKPMIATRVGGIPELVSDGATGFLVPQGDAPAMARRIGDLLNDRRLRSRMGTAARLVAEEKFDVRDNVRRVLEFTGVASA